MFEISTDRDRVDVGMVHAFLSGSSYWARGRSREVVVASIANSLCFGAYRSDQQVGFCRVVTDYAVFGYVADMFVLPEWRGHGVARMLMQAIVDHPVVTRLQGLQLRSRDARGLYEKFGFKAIAGPEEMMVRHTPRGGS
jgi:GNAT superfamily N-acetyltransferase